MSHLRWGVLGCARIADAKVLPAMQASGNGRLEAIASRDPAKAKAFAAKHGARRWHASYDALLADPDIDAIYLPLPTSEHAAWALRAIAAGKPVLVEKPFASSRQEAERVLAAAKASGIVVGEGWMYRFHPLALRMRELVRQGAIGRPEVLGAWFSANIARDDFRWRPGPGSGAMADLGGYCTGIMRFILGEEPTAIAATARFVDGVDASVAGSLSFPCGAVGNFSCTMASRFACGYEVYGETGRLRVDWGGMVAWPGASFDIEIWDAEGALRRETIAPADPYQLMLEAFVDGLRGGPTFPVGPAETLANLDAIEAVIAAARDN